MTPQLANGAGRGTKSELCIRGASFSSKRWKPLGKTSGAEVNNQLAGKPCQLSSQFIQSLEKAFRQFSSLSSPGGECILSQVGKLQARCFVTGGRHSRLMHLCGEMHKTPPVVVNGGGRVHLERGDDELSGEGGS